MRPGNFGAAFGQGLQHRGIRAPGAAAGAAPAWQLHLVEQDFAQHLRAAQVEGAAGHCRWICVSADRHALAEIGGQAPQLRLVDGDAGTLHLRQHGDEPALQLFVQRWWRGHPPSRDAQARGAAAAHAVRGLRHVGRGAVGGELSASASRAAPGAGDRIQPGHPVAEMQARQIIQRMGVRPGVLRVGQQHRIVHRGAPGPNPARAKRVHCPALASWNTFSTATGRRAATGSRAACRAGKVQSGAPAGPNPPAWATGT